MTISIHAASGNAFEYLIPRPASISPISGWFTLNANAAITLSSDLPALHAIGHYLSSLLKPATGYQLPITSNGAHLGNIVLELSQSDLTLGTEGYQLTISTETVLLSAPQPAGLAIG